MSDEIIFHEFMLDPPTVYVQKLKKIKIDKTGKVITEEKHYLTANLFYSGSLHWAQQMKIINWAKDWLLPQMASIPKIDKCEMQITYHYPTDGFDLDNKGYFWMKLILDIMKTPSSKQILKAREYENDIKTIESLKDDTVRYVPKITMEYKKGESAIELKIIGRLAETQGQLF